MKDDWRFAKISVIEQYPKELRKDLVLSHRLKVKILRMQSLRAMSISIISRELCILISQAYVIIGTQLEYKSLSITGSLGWLRTFSTVFALHLNEDKSLAADVGIVAGDDAA